MNFDFIKNLDGISDAYYCCENAEELVKAKPDLSMIASRKSAEIIAKYVYLVAHSENVAELSFSEILSDYSVKNYLRQRDVLDAFHFIRRNGNTAAHTLTPDSPDIAMAVLEALHFAVGEVAKRMGLITKYPRFSNNIASNSDAVLNELIEVDKVAQKMYADYIASRDRANKCWAEFKDLCSPLQLYPGNVDLNETLEFKNKPTLCRTISKIQEHFGFLAVHAMKYLLEESHERELQFFAEITIYGENGFTTSGLPEFMDALMNAVPNADGFRISSQYYGPSVAPWFNNEVKEEFSDVISDIGSQEQFTYTVFDFQYNHGGGCCSKYENGKWVDLGNQYSQEILDRDFGRDWWCWNQDLSVDFEFERHPDILKALHDCVRENIPADQVEYCEATWKYGDVGILCSSIAWYPRKLRVVQSFLDKLNRILLPIMNECSGDAMGNWYIATAPFAVASWEWTEDGFKLAGTVV